MQVSKFNTKTFSETTHLQVNKFNTKTFLENFRVERLKNCDLPWLVETSRSTRSTRAMSLVDRLSRPLLCDSSTSRRLVATSLSTRNPWPQERPTRQCWYCKEPWNREHRCRQGRTLHIMQELEDEPGETSELEHSPPNQQAFHTALNTPKGREIG